MKITTLPSLLIAWMLLLGASCQPTSIHRAGPPEIKLSAIADTSCWMSPQIFSVTESSTIWAVISRNRPPMASYDSNLLTYDNNLYCSMLSDIEAICEPKSLHWHLPCLRRELHSWKETSIDQRIEYI